MCIRDREDIERKIIRCVGNPLERFTEDALRIMRAVRFSAQLGFAIEEESRKALKVLAPNLKHARSLCKSQVGRYLRPYLEEWSWTFCWNYPNPS